MASSREFPPFWDQRYWWLWLISSIVSTCETRRLHKWTLGNMAKPAERERDWSSHNLVLDSSIAVSPMDWSEGDTEIRLSPQNIENAYLSFISHYDHLKIVEILRFKTLTYILYYQMVFPPLTSRVKLFLELTSWLWPIEKEFTVVICADSDTTLAFL